MAFIQTDIHSETLGTRCKLNAIIPLPFGGEPETRQSQSVPRQTLFLLHGLHSNFDVWSRYSSIERYANEKNLAVIMPEAGRSFYTNMVHGYRYFDFFTNELPQIVNQLFPLSQERSDRFIAGLSMGGFGAFKIALSRPDLYCAAASLSGALDLRAIADSETLVPEWPIIFGDNQDITGSDHDLLELSRHYMSGNNPKLALYQCCGTEDYLYPSNQSFLQHSRNIGLDVHYEEGPGAHEWSYWDRQIQSVINWLPLRNVGNQAFS